MAEPTGVVDVELVLKDTTIMWNEFSEGVGGFLGRLTHTGDL